ncbi:zinc finger and SCAN domain-containing protein 2 [Oryzias melastigma]|uniref:zinc finger and SCAN domain-containing protein 2 n=1 Tax=Oryzias melastigma TaxID=30732 RepID=UPI000CF80C8A|nr:zinc finger and SCAN domain-containing protein 2 [Oryzias melastigma]
MVCKRPMAASQTQGVATLHHGSINRRALAAERLASLQRRTGFGVNIGAAAVKMSSVQSLREFIGERLTAAAEEIFSHVEKTIFKLEEEVESQRRVMDMMMKSHLQLRTTALPQSDPWNQDRTSIVDQEDSEPPQVKEQQEEVCISLDEDQLSLKQEEDILMVTLDEEDDLHSQQFQTRSFNVTYGQEEDLLEASTSTTDGEPQNSSRSHVQNEDSSHASDPDSEKMSEGDSCDETSKKKRKNFTCKDCGKKYSTISTLTNHRRIHSGETPYRCGECGKSFHLRSTFRSHVLAHKPAKPFFCDLCGKGFSENSHLTGHMRIHTEAQFFCEECGKSFRHGCNLKRHMLTHTGEKPFSCEECDKSFSQSTTLRNHMTIHTGAKPFACTECDKSFNRRSTLENHMKTHTGARPFLCKVCGKSFTLKMTLTSHSRIHTGERPFSCEECDKSFTHRTSLKKHMKTHLKETFCGVGSVSFSRTTDFTEHMRRHDKFLLPVTDANPSPLHGSAGTWEELPEGTTPLPV